MQMVGNASNDYCLLVNNSCRNCKIFNAKLCMYKFNENRPFSGGGSKLISWSNTIGQGETEGRGQMTPRLYVKQDAGADVHGVQLKVKMKTCISCSVRLAI
jgi:hypothetical protein